MLTTQHRFHGHGSLRFVYAKGQTVRGNLLSIKYVTNPRRRQWRAAVVVSRKVSKSAVKRNRIRRRIYEILRLAAVKINTPYDIVITVFSEEISGLSHEELNKLILDQLKRAGITSS